MFSKKFLMYFTGGGQGRSLKFRDLNTLVCFGAETVTYHILCGT